MTHYWICQDQQPLALEFAAMPQNKKLALVKRALPGNTTQDASLEPAAKPLSVHLRPAELGHPQTAVLPQSTLTRTILDALANIALALHEAAGKHGPTPPGHCKKPQLSLHKSWPSAPCQLYGALWSNGCHTCPRSRLPSMPQKIPRKTDNQAKV